MCVRKKKKEKDLLLDSHPPHPSIPQRRPRQLSHAWGRERLDADCSYPGQLAHEGE